MKRIRALQITTVMVIVGIAFLAAPVWAATVLGNYPPDNENTNTGISSVTIKALVFQVPAGPDYQLNSFTARLRLPSTDPVTIIVDLYTTTGAVPGAFVANVGTVNVNSAPLVYTDYTFTPASPITLNAGQMYWLQLRGLEEFEFAGWSARDPSVTPTGIFTFIGYRFSTNSGGGWFNSSLYNFFTLDATAILVPPTITSAALASVAANALFSHTFTASGNPAPTFSYADENLPPGITLTGDTLSGTPTTPGNYSITATASNGVGSPAVQVFQITVTGTAPMITSAALASVAANALFSHTFTASGNPAPSFTYPVENLPPGVTRTDDTLSGTPTTPGIYSITAVANNGVDPDADQTFTITVTGDAPIITSAPTGYVEQHSSFSHTFTATGNPAPTLTYSDENLPPGITRTGNTLSGIPTLDGQFSVTVTASNGVDPDAAQVFILTVGGLPVPPPAPNVRDINFDDQEVAHASVPDALADSINIRVLYQNGAPTQWLGGDLYNGGSIGVEGIFDLGVQTAIDIFSPNGLTYFNGGAVFCLKGSGYLIWLAADSAPRMPEIIGSYTVPEFPGFTCATLFEPGTLVLVSQNPVR